MPIPHGSSRESPFRYRHVRRVYVYRGGPRIFEVVVSYDVIRSMWTISVMNDVFEPILQSHRNSLETAKKLGIST